MNPQKLVLTRGDDRTLTATVTAPADLTTATALRFTAKYRHKDHDGSAVFAKTLSDGITVSNATVAIITIADTDWEDRHYDVFVWDLEVRDAAGVVTTLAHGTMQVIDDVTRDAP